MRHIVQKLSQRGNLVLSACDGTFSVIKACMLLHEPRRFKKCKVDPGCVTKPMAQLILFQTLQVFTRESDIDVEEEVCISAEVYVKAVQSFEVQKRLYVLQVSAGLPPMQTFLPHFYIT